jgi:hypothetical protein
VFRVVGGEINYYTDQLHHSLDLTHAGCLLGLHYSGQLWTRSSTSCSSFRCPVMVCLSFSFLIVIDMIQLVIADPVFIQHFFLTYRRFATPRSVLLGMQKRMIELGKETRDPLLAKFAQMRLVLVLSPSNSIDCIGSGGL